MKFEHQNNGTCSRMIYFEVEEDGTVHNVEYVGGCNGNVQGLAKLVEGMHIDEIIARLDGIRCGSKPTSCPDQLADALKQAKESMK